MSYPNINQKATIAEMKQLDDDELIRYVNEFFINKYGIDGKTTMRRTYSTVANYLIGRGIFNDIDFPNNPRVNYTTTVNAQDATMGLPKKNDKKDHQNELNNVAENARKGIRRMASEMSPANNIFELVNKYSLLLRDFNRSHDNGKLDADITQHTSYYAARREASKLAAEEKARMDMGLSGIDEIHSGEPEIVDDSRTNEDEPTSKPLHKRIERQMSLDF